jgi:Zn-dependent protease
MADLLNTPFLIAILAALTVHEWAHAFVADRLGDHTARDEGRLTLNPVAHLDPIGTLMFFLVHFGWGKPVPVDPRNFRHPKRDNALVALAGPASNFLLAFVSLLLLLWFAPQMLHVGSAEELLFVQGFGQRFQAFGAEVLANTLFVNLGLMAFNLLPIAPLDGSTILHPFVPIRHEEQYERFLQNGPFILIGLLLLERLLNVPILITWISFIMDVALRLMTVFF